MLFSVHADRRLPRIPVWMLPKVWGLSQTLITQYITKEPDGSVVIGGGKCLQVRHYYVVILLHMLGHSIIVLLYGIFFPLLG